MRKRGGTLPVWIQGLLHLAFVQRGSIQRFAVMKDVEHHFIRRVGRKGFPLKPMTQTGIAPKHRAKTTFLLRSLGVGRLGCHGSLVGRICNVGGARAAGAASVTARSLSSCHDGQKTAPERRG
jgi:hypothetical protein